MDDWFLRDSIGILIVLGITLSAAQTVEGIAQVLIVFVGAGSYYSLSGGIIGSGLAGFLAANGSGHFKRAGMGSGVLGTVPAFAWSSDFLRNWFIASASEGGQVFAVALLCLFVLATGMLGVSAPSAASSAGGSPGKSNRNSAARTS